MCKIKEFNEDSIEWYSSRGHQDEGEKDLANAEKILYNIDVILKDKSISDDGALLLIQKEINKWKESTEWNV